MRSEMRSTTNLLLLLVIIGIYSIDAEPELSRSVAKCTDWHKKEASPEVHLAKTLNPPCSIPSTFPKELKDGWKTDPGCDASKQPNTCSYHKGAHGCYRHAKSRTGPGAQSCYDRQGNWIADPWKGAGTLDKHTPLGSLLEQLNHYNHDVVPWENCCNTAGNPQPTTCNLYFEKRPPGVCEEKPAI